MAKAITGHLPHNAPSRIASENRHLRTRVADLEALVRRLQDDNDRLTALHAERLLEGADLAEVDSLA